MADGGGIAPPLVLPSPPASNREPCCSANHPKFTKWRKAWEFNPLRFYPGIGFQDRPVCVPAAFQAVFRGVRNSLAYHLLEKFQADREKIERYSAVAERCPLPVFVIGSDGVSILYTNPAYMELTGRTIEELQDGNWPLVIHPDDREEVKLAWKMFTETNTLQPHWHRYIHKNGTITEAMTLVDRVEGNGYVGFIMPQCGDETCPVRRLNTAMWSTWASTKDMFRHRSK